MAQQQEIFLPMSVRREMLGFFSVEELLTVEQVDTFWRRTLRDSGKWNTFSLTHDNDAQKNDRLIRRVAFAHGSDVEQLKLINCVFSNELIVEIGARFSGLKELVVSGCKMLSDEALAVLLRASSHSLVEVRAVKCPLLTDDTLQALGTYQSESIERVDFSHCRLMSSAGVNTVVQECKKLSEFGFKGCPKVNDAAMLAIATHCGAQVRRVSVGGSGNISDHSLQALADHCSGLQELDIARSNPFGIGRGGVSNQGLLYLVFKCRDLRRLVLRGQGQLSLSVLSNIAACCPKLQSLDIGGCRQIIQDPIALSVELKRMALLEQLSVSFARGLKDEHINCIAAQCPQLKRFEVDGSQVAVSCV
uniref:F-box/LRR-repeat protein 15-like leucin rich repeat domain-containing protein n=1 Tax=Globisporangium ultimum (strain ATCC 200006 / CBS 805.95 / DAOM BR144) TaxID=431595 RepID=K3X2Z6_GLOUD